MRTVVSFGFQVVLITSTLLLAPSSADAAAQQVLNASGVQGGLIVHLGCGDGRLTADLCAGDAYLVHGLARTAKSLSKSRAHVRSRGLYGRVAVDMLAGRELPYIDNSVNLLVAEDLGEVPMAEVMRVLCPKGVACIKEGDRWRKSVKPRPDDTDEWTHYLHDPSNNAVAHDTAVDHLRHLQWLGGPKWSRHHDHMSSSTAIVSANGRNFYVFDEAPASSIQLPAEWSLIARDAFNGKVLWKRPIDSWHTQMWRLKSGPASLPRRLVAVDDTVYVTLAHDAPVTALDATTGRTIRTYEDTRGTEEILCDDGTLFLVVNDAPVTQPLDPKHHDYRVQPGKRRIMAVAAGSGRTVWSKTWSWVAPVTLAVEGSRVLFFDGEQIACLDREDGDERWRSQTLGKRLSVPSYFAPTLVVYEDVVLFSGSDTGSRDYHVDNGLTLTALDADSGRTLWQAQSPPSGYRSPEDILVVDGLVWTDAFMWGRERDDFPDIEWGTLTGRDPRTGEVKASFGPDVDTYWFHHRCYRAKATDRYILASRTGIEFIDPDSEHWTCHHWVRGACLYGILPANGMVYTSPHPCACYLEAKLYGFNALAPTSPSRRVPRDVAYDARLKKGPAYGVDLEVPDCADEWPTYRRDGRRSGYTPASVPTSLQEAWRTSLGGELSAVVIGAGKLLVGQVDEHTVYALDAETGDRSWSFTAGGRVDSPPTVWEGRVLFGSADGCVYCLRASDGALIWRFRAAPVDRRLVAFEQVESLWPVHGSVLVEGGVAWCVAGRSMFLDGGLRLLRLDPGTGKKLSEHVLDGSVPETEDDLQTLVRGLDMPVALPDILSSDGQYVYMRSQRFDQEGGRLAIDAPTGNVRDQQGEGAHLFSPTGFLDDADWHRSYWVYGLRWASGAGGYFKAGRFAPAGRILAFDDTTVYGFRREPDYFRWTTPIERYLYACDKAPKIERYRPPHTKKGFRAMLKPEVGIETRWTQPLPLHVRAMVLSDGALFVAGPHDVVDETESLRTFAEPQTQAKLSEQSRVLKGESGGLLCAVSPDDGGKLAEYRLAELPVWDGMAAAKGRLYLATQGGRVICWKASTPSGL